MRTKKRILSMLVSVCLIVGLFPTTAFAAETDTGKAIQLGTGGISGYDSTTGYDYIYMGDWEAPDENTTSGPIKWGVLDDQTNTGGSGLFLLSDVLLGTDSFGGLYFDKSEPQNYAWQGSGAQAWCKDFAGIEGSSVTDAFTVGELGAVLATTKSDGAFTSSTGSVPFDASDDVLNGDKVFFLSAEEAENSAYGFTDDNARVANYGTSGGTWWLRSPCALGSVLAGAVWETGYVYYYSVGDYTWAARPAFNLDPDSVLFTSAADNSGHSASFAAPTDYSGNEWKLTLKDGNSFATGASVTGTTALVEGYAETELTISHAALSSLSSDYTNVTAMLTDESGELLYYGSINSDTSATSSTVTIPAGLPLGEYTLSVYGEDWNDAKYTDYATRTPFTTTITVHAHSWGTDWRSDSTHHWHECENSDCPVTDDSSKDGYTTHSFTVETVKDEALKSAANCTNPATYYKSCECGAVSTSDTDTFTSGSAAGHDWGDWTSTNDTQHSRTCKNDGNHTESAEHSFDDACDTDCNDGCGYTRTTTHSYGTEWSKDATGHWHECSVCHDKKDNAAHTPGAAATEDTPQTCTECGYEIAPALGHTHTWGGWTSNGNGTHTRTCSANSSHTENGNCSGGTATCQSPATCSICNTTYGSTNSSNHTGGTEIRNASSATATTAGYTGDTYCLGCNTKIKTGTTIPATGGEEPLKSPDTGDNTPAYVTHTVQKGDTLWAIAKKYGCTVSEIVAANSDLIKDPDLIYAGWQLKIPQAGATGTDTTPDAILPDDKKTTVYIVKQGDTLWAISKKYGCTVAEIIALNGELIADPDLIFAGWEIKIPQD